MHFATSAVSSAACMGTAAAKTAFGASQMIDLITSSTSAAAPVMTVGMYGMAVVGLSAANLL